MNHGGELILIILALGMALFIQLRASKMRSSVWGLVLPFLLLLLSVCVLVQDIQHIRQGTAEEKSTLMALTYFAVYNIPTILFLCIYNYCQRKRITRENKAGR